VPPQGEIRLRAAYHDACHLAHAQQVRSAPRKLLSMIPGLELVPLAESEVCCGAAGTYNLTEPEMSRRLAERKRDHILATRADALLTANAGCLLQIAKSLRQVGSPMWVAHPIDVLDLSYRGQQPPIRNT
jgi:glycolate oxidase iron-sulfur subunit